jgi:prephenate dehydrogenase
MTTTSRVPFARVHIVGTGLLGTSLGLALIERGVEVTLSDASPAAMTLALDYGAGVARTQDTAPPELVVVATPPDVVSAVVTQMLGEYPDALVVDVASVKQSIYEELAGTPEVKTRFVGTHPMAGRERGGALSARSDLFTARPWVLCEGHSDAREALRALVLSLGAIPAMMSAHEHDEAVSVVSHLPQIMASLSAARLAHASPAALALAGAGVRDVTRIAASDPSLWVQIIAANSEPILSQLRDVAEDLGGIIHSLESLGTPGSRAALATAFHNGVAGVSRLPGKHGVSASVASLIVVIDDTPGELARLLTQLVEWDVNLEDLRLEHSPGANVGFADLSLAKNVVEQVEHKLLGGGWKIAGETR